MKYLHELCLTHEEAHTHLLQHAIQQGFRRVIIQSPDTDVAIIACGLAQKILARLVFRNGTSHRTRFLDISAMASTVVLVKQTLLSGCMRLRNAIQPEPLWRREEVSIYFTEEPTVLFCNESAKRKVNCT